MAYIEGPTFDLVYPKLLDRIGSYGKETNPRGMKTVEISPMVFQLHNADFGLLTIPERGINYYFMLMECVWMLLGSDDAKLIGFFNKGMAKFSDDGIKMSGAYGPKIVNQINYVIETLEGDPDSRQALMTIWRENPGPSKDIPCTVMFHFLVRDKRLNLIVYMRSNDLWLGTPYDVFNFTTIQRLLASRLNLVVGSYTHIAGSLHLYEKDFGKVDNFLGGASAGFRTTFEVDHFVLKQTGLPHEDSKFSIFDPYGREWFHNRLKEEMSRSKGPDSGTTWDNTQRIYHMALTPFWTTALEMPYARHHKDPDFAGYPFRELQSKADEFRKKNRGTKS